METSARYILIGLFGIAAITGAFLFVYWLKAIGGPGQRVVYRVQFERTVSGLRAGSAVLFNGVRVGDVTGLTLNPDHPSRVTAEIAIGPDTPLRSDTRVDVDIQGLMGSPSLLLQGGSSASPRLSPGQVLIAEQSAGADTMQTARQTLQHIDNLLAENSEPLHNAITNFEKFSGALARNSDRVDGIVTGVERMTGSGPAAPPSKIITLRAPQAFPGLEKAAQAQLVVPDPTALLMLDTRKILIWSNDQGSSLADTQWSDNLPKLLQAKVIESFDRAGSLAAVAVPNDAFKADYQMLLDLRAFQIAREPMPTAQIEFSAKILNRDGKTIGTRIFQGSAAVQAIEASAVAAGFDRAFDTAARDLVVWGSALIHASGAGQPDSAKSLSSQ
ncbi:MAG: membrane integrity-associated transporter subunit PqiC [Xanthobacteraceae bacterium]|nr:membrane integrity-associated transporter subunit PqiC [Xanthobacteraceae bacterium]